MKKKHIQKFSLSHFLGFLEGQFLWAAYSLILERWGKEIRGMIPDLDADRLLIWSISKDYDFCSMPKIIITTKTEFLQQKNLVQLLSKEQLKNLKIPADENSIRTLTFVFLPPQYLSIPIVGQTYLFSNTLNFLEDLYEKET